MIFQILDVVSLWAIWWCAFAALISGHEVRTWRGLVLQAALIGMMVSAFTGAITLYVQPGLLPEWGRGLVYATAALMLWLYDYHYGLARHARMARDAVRQFPHRFISAVRCFRARFRRKAT